MSQTPQVSILLPTYNGERYLQEQVDSLLAQTAEDFELVIIDDGSTDATPALIADFAAQDARIRVLPSQGNRGHGQRLAQLAEAARGRFVCISDQDDRWDPERNARLLEAMPGAAVALGRSQMMDGEGRPLGRTLLDELGITPDMRLRLTSLHQPRFSGHAMMMRRDWLNLAAFNQAIFFDWAIGVEGSFSGGVVYVDQAVVHHRVHGGNQMNSFDHLAGARLTKADVRWSFLYRQYDRMNLVLTLDYLARSPRIDTALLPTFRTCAQLARFSWFSGMRTLGLTSHTAREALLRELEPLAGSDEDREKFREKIRSLTYGPLNPAQLSEGVGNVLYRMRKLRERKAAR